jgi:hypothetical protein
MRRRDGTLIVIDFSGPIKPSKRCPVLAGLGEARECVYE